MTLLKSDRPIKTASQEVKEARDRTLNEVRTQDLLAHLVYRHRVGLLICGYPLVGMLVWLVFKVF